MKDLVRYGSVGLLMVIALAALFLVAPFPVAYAPENITYPRTNHVNNEVLRERALSSEATLYPVMQDLLDYSGPVMISIRSDNFEEARQDILEYIRRQGDLRHLIVNLDMNGTEVRDFLESQERQAEILGDLVNTTSAFEELTTLEVKYREEGDEGALVSISYQGQSLKERVHALQERYREESLTVTPLALRHGLENASYDESLDELTALVGKVDRAQGDRDRRIGASVSPAGEASLSLLVQPETGRYLDEVRVFGSRSGEARSGRPVTVTLDGSPVASLETDGRGAFSTPYIIERVPSGNHSLGAESAGIMAGSRTLSVDPVDSRLNLTVLSVKNSSRVTCSGYLVANRPVRHAPVEILWEGHDTVTAVTDSSGFFRAVLVLPAGTHRIRAWFENGSYPVSPSMSETYEITSTGAGIPAVRKEEPARWANGTFVGESPAGFNGADMVARVLPIVFIGLMAAVAALGYLRRGERRGMPGATPPSRPGAAPAPSLDLFREVPTPEEPLGSLYRRGLGDLGLSGAAHLVYSRFAAIVGGHEGIGEPSLFTAREIARACTGRPYGRVFLGFVRCYERVRYAGEKGEKTRRRFEDSMERTRAALEGERR
jgi:hypothetical protein